MERKDGENKAARRTYSKPTVEVRQLVGVVNGIGTSGTDVAGLGPARPRLVGKAGSFARPVESMERGKRNAF